MAQVTLQYTIRHTEEDLELHLQFNDKKYTSKRFSSPFVHVHSASQYSTQSVGSFIVAVPIVEQESFKVRRGHSTEKTKHIFVCYTYVLSSRPLTMQLLFIAYNYLSQNT